MFQEVANTLGLPLSDEHYSTSLRKASLWKTGSKLWQMLAVILCHGSPSNPSELWRAHIENLNDDCLHELRFRRPDLLMTHDQLENYCLHLLKICLSSMDKSSRDVGMQQVNEEWIAELQLEAVDTGMAEPIFRHYSQHRVEVMSVSLNEEQNPIFQHICETL